MSDTTPRTCPNCGVALDDQDGSALCPACLMSEVLRRPANSGTSGDAPTAGGIDEHETAPLQPGERTPASGSLELPHELGEYTLVSLLGQGGMGTVYEAVQRSTGRRLALKLLSQPLDTPEMRDRFLREGRLAARVNHPCSLYVYGSEEIEGVPAITMEISGGGTLQDLLGRRGPFAVTQAVDAILNIVDGLDAAGRRGVLHRDIKPSNCFVAADGTVKIGDFGLSVSTLPSADSFVTQSGKVMGTPAFASPEQLRGDGVDARSDIYAVGATLFTLLTARAPFEGENAIQIVANVIDTPPPSVSDHRDDVPVGLQRVIARCLAKDPAGRFNDYESLRDALLPFSSTIPESATTSQRTAAGWIDFVIALLPPYAAMMLIVGGETLLVRPLYVLTLAAWSYYLIVFGVGFAYFAVSEGIWGAGLGKWIIGLRVVRRNRKRPGIGRALLRVLIPIATIEAVRVPLSIALLPTAEWAPHHTLIFVALSIFCPLAVILLWIPARRGNGFAAAWDLVTGTRVVVRPQSTHRPAMTPAQAPTASDERSAHVGPFLLSGEIAAGHWLAATDPTLRRDIWLVRRTDTFTPGERRRGVARTGRPRWLQEVASDEHAWDAFEAVPGAPLSERIRQWRGGVPWSTLRFWLHDLAAELWASNRDDTLPSALSLDHVWITDDGRAMLLDLPWPDAQDQSALIPTEDLAGQQAFLRHVSELVDPLTVPLHAQPVLRNLRQGSFEKLTFLTGTLRGLLEKPAEVTRGLRAASLLIIPGYTWVAVLLGRYHDADPNVGILGWGARIAIAGFVMLLFMAVTDFFMALWRRSAGPTAFSLEFVTAAGRASRTRMLVRWAIMWLPVTVAGAVLGSLAVRSDGGVSLSSTAIVAAVALAGAAVFATSAIVNPTRGLQDRLAGVWVGRR